MLKLRQALSQHVCSKYGYEESFVSLFQDILIGNGKLVGPNKIQYGLPGRVDIGGSVTAKDIIIATGSVPFVPPGIPIDGKTVNIQPDQIICIGNHPLYIPCSGQHTCPDLHRIRSLKVLGFAAGVGSGFA